MNEVIAVLETPLFNVVLAMLLFAIATILAVVLYYKAKPKAKISFVVRDVSVLGEAHSAFSKDLEVRFRGANVPRVTATHIGVWNSGNDTVLGDQIAIGDPLRVKVADNAALLDARIVSTSRPVLNAALDFSTETQEAKFDFDFLDPGDGFVMQIVHSGAYGATACFGTVRRIPAGLTEWRVRSAGVKAMMMLAIAAFLATLITAAKLLTLTDRWRAAGLEWTNFMLLAACTVAVTVFYALGSFNFTNWFARRKVPKVVKGDPVVAPALYLNAMSDL